MADPHGNAPVAMRPDSDLPSVAQLIAGTPENYHETFLRLVSTDYAKYLLPGRGGFKYLSWSFAVDHLLKEVPDARFKICEFGSDIVRNTVTGQIVVDEFGDPKYNDGVPYQKTDVGYFVRAKVLVAGVIRDIRLPVLGEDMEPLDKPTAKDINNSGMRVLVKAIALHGLGLYVYNGEDVPGEGVKSPTKKATATGNKSAPAANAPNVASVAPQTAAAVLDTQVRRVALANSDTLMKMYGQMSGVFPDPKDLAVFSKALDERAKTLFPDPVKLAAFYEKAKAQTKAAPTRTANPAKPAAQPKEALAA